MTPAVSVIVPVYQVENCLRRCLESLAGQTLKDIEIVCVDDGSSDRSPEILSACRAKDPRFRVIRQANAGQSVARNAGLDAATGEFVMFCDADDWAEPTWCEELYGAIAGRPQADLVVSRAFIDGICSKKRRRELEHNQRLRFSGERAASVELFPRVDHSLWTKVFRRSMLERYGLRFPVCEFCEDWSFSYACLAVCRNVVFLDCPLYHYVQREGSTLNGGERSERIALDFVRQWDRLRQFLVSVGKWSEWRLPMLEYGVRMFGIGGERLSSKACSLAEGFLRSMPPEELSDLPRRLAADLMAVRNRTLCQTLNSRFGIGPLTVFKRTRDIAGDRVSICGVRLYTKWF